MKVYKRRLSQREINNCENARTPRCACRCGGRMHGARRAQEEKGFQELPETDPHHLEVKKGKPTDGPTGPSQP